MLPSNTTYSMTEKLHTHSHYTVYSHTTHIDSQEQLVHSMAVHLFPAHFSMMLLPLHFSPCHHVVMQNAVQVPNTSQF